MKKNLRKTCKIVLWSGKLESVNKPTSYHYWGFSRTKGWTFRWIDEKGKKHKNAPRQILNT